MFKSLNISLFECLQNLQKFVIHTRILYRRFSRKIRQETRSAFILICKGSGNQIGDHWEISNGKPNLSGNFTRLPERVVSGGLATAISSSSSNICEEELDVPVESVSTYAGLMRSRLTVLRLPAVFQNEGFFVTVKDSVRTIIRWL